MYLFLYAVWDFGVIGEGIVVFLLEWLIMTMLPRPFPDEAAELPYLTLRRKPGCLFGRGGVVPPADTASWAFFIDL